MEILKRVTKKMLKIIGIIILIPIALIVLFVVIATFAEMVPKNYTKEVKTGGSIEAKYLKYGQYEVKDIKVDGSEEVTKNFYIYYPSELDGRRGRRRASCARARRGRGLTYRPRARPCGEVLGDGSATRRRAASRAP